MPAKQANLLQQQAKYSRNRKRLKRYLGNMHD